jgi:hypothetical protein
MMEYHEYGSPRGHIEGFGRRDSRETDEARAKRSVSTATRLGRVDTAGHKACGELTKVTDPQIPRY